MLVIFQGCYGEIDKLRIQATAVVLDDGVGWCAYAETKPGCLTFVVLSRADRKIEVSLPVGSVSQAILMWPGGNENMTNRRGTFVLRNNRLIKLSDQTPEVEVLQKLMDGENALWEKYVNMTPFTF